MIIKKRIDDCTLLIFFSGDSIHTQCHWKQDDWTHSCVSKMVDFCIRKCKVDIRSRQRDLIWLLNYIKLGALIIIGICIPSFLCRKKKKYKYKRTILYLFIFKISLFEKFYLLIKFIYYFSICFIIHLSIDENNPMEYSQDFSCIHASCTFIQFFFFFLVLFFIIIFLFCFFSSFLYLLTSPNTYINIYLCCFSFQLKRENIFQQLVKYSPGGNERSVRA